MYVFNCRKIINVYIIESRNTFGNVNAYVLTDTNLLNYFLKN